MLRSPQGYRKTWTDYHLDRFLWDIDLWDISDTRRNLQEVVGISPSTGPTTSPPTPPIPARGNTNFTCLPRKDFYHAMASRVPWATKRPPDAPLWYGVSGR